MGIDKKIDCFIEVCNEKGWWIFCLEFIRRFNMTDFVAFGFKFFTRILEYIPSGVISGIMPRMVVLKYLNFFQEKRHRQNSVQSIIRFLREYLEVFPPYIIELYKEYQDNEEEDGEE